MTEKYRGKELVFGDLLKWYDIEVKSKLSDANKLYDEIKLLEKNIFIAFVSFILAHRGYYNETMVNFYPWDVKDRTEYTTEFNDTEWIKFTSDELAFTCFEEMWKIEKDEYNDLAKGAIYKEILREYEEWTVKYRNNKANKIIKVIFITSKTWPEFMKVLSTRYKDSDDVFNGYLSKSENTEDFFVVHPLAYEENKAEFQDINKKLAERLNRYVLFSVDGFLHKMIQDNMIQDNREKEMIKERWIVIRDEALKEVRRRWPVIVFSTHADILSKIDEYIFHAESKYFLGREHFRDAIRDAALACETLLSILYEIYTPVKIERPSFFDYMCSLKEFIEVDFGEIVYNDLDFIRNCRNKVSHAPPEELDDLTTFQVIRRATIL